MFANLVLYVHYVEVYYEAKLLDHE